MTPFYSRTGDDGTTGLLGEGRVAKSDIRIETLGSLDEATAALGLARAFSASSEIRTTLEKIQRDLYHVMAEVAATDKNAGTFKKIGEKHIGWLEEQVASFSKTLTLPREFIIPGDTPSGAYLDLARTVVRRAERRLVEMNEAGLVQNPNLLAYLNRLSSLCFILEIKEIQLAGKASPTQAKWEKQDDRNLD